MYAAVVFGDPQRWSRHLGVVAIIAVFLTAVVLVFGTLGYVMESRALPAVLDFVNFRRLPVILSLVALALLSNQFALPGYHDFQRLDDVALPAESQITAEEAFERWTSANLTDAQKTDSRARAGGDRMVRRRRRWRSRLPPSPLPPSTVCSRTTTTRTGATPATTPTRTTGCSPPAGRPGAAWHASVVAERADGQIGDDWVQDRLGNDLLSPELTWQAGMVEVPNAIAGFQPGQAGVRS